ncbi:hypothetical protein DFA_07274 [Cavenderia fasciculata]|uniref:Sulphur transport domain-containing protein n=1 Tax=Cavenderia fasciculata TaxID=261658 RepID=F4PVZ0_CACFS|nr:uncharacterized protein DFA_07274 [Cavenderia fasciculata]EGG20154.1 hypothetical protein DFA_07274 [Cavenderia fasciculata]|eukprot:XP_004367137.1 hypothetical protein DFA_07274 [Cavenderia fasciculata]
MSDNQKKTTTSLSSFDSLKASLSGLAVGTLFGYALQRSKVFLPIVIQQQMQFTNFTMLKMFMTASLTSSLTITALNKAKLIKFEYLPVMWHRNLLGGLLMGAGIYVTGACPGTVLAQVGSGVTSAYYTLLGGLLGAVLYGYADPYVTKLMPASPPTVKPTLFQRLNTSMEKTTIPFALMAGAMLYGIESLIPWQADSNVSLSISAIQSLSTSVWSPYVAGVLIGLLQAPSYFLANNGLGCSSAYVTMSAKVCDAFNCGVSYFNKFANGVRSVYGPMLNIGIILGAYLSSQTSPVPDSQKLLSHSPLFHIGAGALLLFGARMANGCTSGHGLTGMAKMELGSIITVAALFGGGMLTAALTNL